MLLGRAKNDRTAGRNLYEKADSRTQDVNMYTLFDSRLQWPAAKSPDSDHGSLPL